jgi:hypothetical protein
MREEITLIALLTFDCDAERSKAEQTEDCLKDIGRLQDADSTTGVALTNATVLHTSSESETYGTEAASTNQHKASRAEVAMHALYSGTSDTTNNAAELLCYMLRDLRHFADDNNLDFADEDRTAYALYSYDRAMS